MSIDVDKSLAKATLIKAMECSKIATDDIGEAISDVLRGTHKTYRYVLFTALLAKATNAEVDALSLQAGDSSDGAYDARSLCHGVVVPFEREHLPHSLGDSNEPFLNKPARFQRISTTNAVRAGKDFATLRMLIAILSKIATKEQAFYYLSSAVYVLKQINQEYEAQFSTEELNFTGNAGTQEILELIDRLTEHASEGETCPLIVSTLESICFPRYNVVPHNVNECGASSKEVGDIDVYAKGENGESVLVSAIEVKDKDFTAEDVQHAISKFQMAHLERTLFIYGKKASFDSVAVYQMASRFGRIGVYCCVISIMDYSRLRLFDSNADITLADFVEHLFLNVRKINAKPDTIAWVRSCIERE